MHVKKKIAVNQIGNELRYLITEQAMGFIDFF